VAIIGACNDDDRSFPAGLGVVWVGRKHWMFVARFVTSHHLMLLAPLN
jgi:hypothetical protein